MWKGNASKQFLLEKQKFSKRSFWIDTSLGYIIFTRGEFKGGGGEHGGAHSSYYSQSLVFFFAITLRNNKLLFEVELILNNAPLTHVYPNFEIETCLTPSHSYGRWLLYSPNVTSINKINRISNHFWDRWRHE